MGPDLTRSYVLFECARGEAGRAVYSCLGMFAVPTQILSLQF